MNGDLKLMTIRPELLDELIKDYKNPEDLIGENGILKQLTKALIEKAMNAELTHELGYEEHSKFDKSTSNRRNGKSEKTISSKHGEMRLEIPRDREGSFEPQIIKKHERRFDGFDAFDFIALFTRTFNPRNPITH